MKRLDSPSDRLIVPLDFKPTPPNGRLWVRDQVLRSADMFTGTNVYMKVNSALRACGYSLIKDLHERGLRVFADLKLFDIPETLMADGALLQELKPELLTTVCTAGITALRALKAELPDTEVLGVTILTSNKEEDVHRLFSCSIEEATKRLAKIAKEASLDGLISSPREAAMLRKIVGRSMTINTPGVRPFWSVVENDDQNPERVMTPKKAILAGADRLVVGRPIMQASNPRDAVMRTLDEITSAMK